MSRRSLYKTAPKQTPPRASRKSLDQGRLIATDPRSLLDNLSASAQSSPSRISSKSRTPQARRSLDYNTLRSSLKNETQPPVYKPQPTITESPSHVKPSSSLSLSDTELDVKSKPVYKQAPLRKQVNDPVVLTVDASQRHSSFASKEVPVKTSYVKSPVKVVCHSTRDVSEPDTSHYANSGKVTIPVESVPRMNMSQRNINNDSQSSTSPQGSEASVSTVAGSPVDPRSRAVETLVIRGENNPRSYVSFLEADDDESDVMKALDQSEIHVTQPKFYDTVISSIDGDSKLSSFTGETRKKKRKARAVQSKYMASASVKPEQKPITTKSGNTSQRNKRTMGTKPVHSVQNTEKNKSRSISMKEKKTKDLQSDNDRGKKPKFTSTPSDVVQPMTNLSVNIPGIAPTTGRSFGEPTHFTFTTPTKDQSHTKKTNVKDSSHEEAKDENISATRPATKQSSPDISQQQSDLYYNGMLQWQFLRSKFKHTFEKQEKNAQTQLYSLWQLDQELRSKEHELKMEYEAKRKREEVDRQLELQISLLKAVEGNSSKLLRDYHKLYKGIDATRHHMAVKDIILTENEADLLSSLDNCETTLAEITSLLKESGPKVRSFSGEMAVLAETLCEETKEHDRCMELLAAVSTLTTQERSLQAEILQRKEP